MADMATQALARILNGDEYDTVRAVPIFDEHDEFDAAGNLVRRFGKSELEEICRVCNARQTTSGDLSPFGPGHTISYVKDPDGNMVRAPERIQPEIWGYYANYRVGPAGPGGKLVILADQYVKREVQRQDDATGEVRSIKLGAKYVADQFPRRSIEYWPKSKMIDWIASLRRTPERDLGIMCYSADLAGAITASAPLPFNPTIFASPGRRRPLSAAFTGGMLCYSVEDHRMPFDPNKTAPNDNPMDPGQQPDANAPDQDFQSKFSACMKQTYPHLDRIHSDAAQKIEAEEAAKAAQAQPAPPGLGGAPGDPMAGNPAAGPAMPAMSPAPATPPGPAPGAPIPIGPTPQKKEAYMNPNDPLRFAKYEADLTAANLRIKQLEEANQAERYAKSEAEANRLLDTLDMAGYCFNRQRELKALIPLAPADRHAHIDELRQYSKRDENRIIVHGHIETGPEPAAVGPRTIDEFNAIRSKAAANGKSVAEAMAANFTN